jgi:hypothetical protein
MLGKQFFGRLQDACPVGGRVTPFLAAKAPLFS